LILDPFIFQIVALYLELEDLLRVSSMNKKFKYLKNGKTSSKQIIHTQTKNLIITGLNNKHRFLFWNYRTKILKLNRLFP